MNCSRWLARLVLSATAVVAVSALQLHSPAFADDQTKPGKSGQAGNAQDSNLVNCPSICDDYRKRYPYAAQHEKKHKREEWSEYPERGDIVLGTENGGTDGADTRITIKQSNLKPLKSSKPTQGDTKAMMQRPQYRPLLVPLGAPAGYFLPPTPPVIQSSSDLSPKTQNPVPVYYQQVPYSYKQDLKQDNNKGNIAQARDEELWDFEMTTFGVPMSDTQFQIIDREDNQRFLELMYDPERWMWVGKAMAEMQRQGLSNSVAGAAEASFDTAVHTVQQSLINVANENAASPMNNSNGNKTLPQAIWMVQQMYKFVYIPMAILFLLPGALITQMKGMVSFGMLGTKDEDTASPFTGIMRAIIAIFLIPATQLIVSYAIDIGNSLTGEVSHYLDEKQLFNWAHAQTYNPPPKNADNKLEPPETFPKHSEAADRKEEGGSGQSQPTPGKFGKGSSEVMEEKSLVEKQTDLSRNIQLFFNSMNYLMATALNVLCTFQMVMMCYLFVMGPIAACLFAWPSGVSSLFKKVFANWVDAVTVLALWRFWWMVVLACMCTRIAWLKEMGAYEPNTQWEMYMYTCFMGLLMYVPFQPFEFKPGEAASKILDEGAKAGGQHGKGAKTGGQQPQDGQAEVKHHIESHSTVSHTTTPGGSHGDGGPSPSGPGSREAVDNAPPRSDGGSNATDSAMEGVSAPPLANTMSAVPVATATADPPRPAPPPMQTSANIVQAPQGTAPMPLVPQGPQTIIMAGNGGGKQNEA